MTDPLITDEIRELLGKETEPTLYVVDKQWLRRFAEAIDDPNPLWQDERFARKTRYGGIIAPPTFVNAMRNDQLARRVQYLNHPLKTLLNMGNEIEFFETIRLGDTITVTAKLADAFVKDAQAGKMVFLVMEMTYRNQYGDVVAIGRNTTSRS